MGIGNEYGASFLSEIADEQGGVCFNYSKCVFDYRPCDQSQLHYVRYSEPSAAWVLIASILVFFMKAGFMLLEVAFARNPKEKRHVVVLKHQDAFASAFGFFLLGFDAISNYKTPIKPSFFSVTDPVLWFFKFTFASNAATIVGGCLVTSKYKLRLPAAFISAFVISGILHPIVARIIWSDHCDTLSPYRFCNYGMNSVLQKGHGCSWNCSNQLTSFTERMYILDFAGGGAVHLIGGMAGLMVCLFAKFREWKDRTRPNHPMIVATEAEVPEDVKPEGFWDWMYPVTGGEETVSEAALGVIILWFCWFAFNCGSAESIETGFHLKSSYNDRYPFYGIPAVIAVNMIMAGASGGTLAIIIAVCAQLRYRTESVNANEIANGVLSALVSITAGCAFVDYWGAVLIGLFGVIFYHCGCFLEYKLKINDTARVVPVHGVCGLWSVIATGLFIAGETSQCNLHAAFEGLCYCQLRLPQLNWIERLGAQIIGAFFMIGVGLVGSFITYFILYIIPISPFVWFFDRVLFLSPKDENGVRKRLVYQGGWLLTCPEEDFNRMGMMVQGDATTYSQALLNESQPMLDQTGIQGRCTPKTVHSNFGTYGVHDNSYGTMNTPHLSTYTNTDQSTRDGGGVAYRGRNTNNSQYSSGSRALNEAKQKQQEDEDSDDDKL